jgi:hypothetical protein
MIKRLAMAAAAACVLIGLAAAVEARQCQTSCNTVGGYTTCNTYCW